MIAYLAHAMRDARAIELRHLDGDRIECGLYADLDRLRAEIEARARSGNLYCTLNRPAAAIRVTSTMGRRGLRDADIARIVRLPLDLDPVRPAGTSSTADELAAAVAARDRLVRDLHAIGWPLPALAVSGNGAHALYRCLLPADERTRIALRTLYRGLAAEYTDETVRFDRTVHNPSRIWRLYGTQNRKGTPTADRPHRVAQIVIPHQWHAVAPAQVYALARLYEQRQSRRDQQGPVHRDHAHLRLDGTGDYRTLDAVAWFSAHGAYRRPLGSGKHAIACPWDREHSTIDAEHSTATVLWETDGGWPTWHCSHAHCAGRTLRDVLALWGDADQYCAGAYRRAS